jgi:DNA mismatch endonuclease (patch repair protein)
MAPRPQSHRPIPIPRYTQFKPGSETASRIKRKNRSKDTSPELLLRRALWGLGLRYRKHADDLPGKPDVVFRRARVVVFYDGDFWHGRDWKRLQKKLAASANAAYWLPKIARNRQRDREQTAALRKQGWHVVRLWEGEVKRDPAEAAREVAEVVRGRLEAAMSA